MTEDGDIDGAFLSSSYQKYVNQQENAGTEPRYIATLSTWLKPNKPIAGHSLQTALEQRAEAKRKAELARATLKAEREKQQEEARLAKLEAAWRESDLEAKRLHAKMRDLDSGFEAVGKAMTEYRDYREKMFKPG